MLVKILLIIAILAGIAATVIGFTQIKPRIEQWQGKLVEETKERIAQTKRAEKAEKNLADTKAELERERGDHEATRNQLAKANEDLREARNTAQRLRGDLDKTRADLDAAKAELAAWNALGIPIEKIKDTLASLKIEKDKNAALEEKNKELADKLRRANDYIAIIMGKKTVDDEAGVPMRSDLRAKVLAVDPKWEFVVLDAGESQDAKVGGNFLICRDGKLISKVKIRSLTENTCVATIMGGWKMVDIKEGDAAVTVLR